MDSSNNKVIRRKFIKGLASAAVCCACFPFEGLATKEEISEYKTGKGKEYLAAACGTFCGACPAYIAKHGTDLHKELLKKSSSNPVTGKGIPPANWMEGLQCDGCLSGGKLAPHCQKCNIRLCALDKQTDGRCTDCEELPCRQVTNLINMGGYLHRTEYLPNLNKMKEMGVQEWIKNEEKRWMCPKCGLPMSWYDAEYIGCGEPRSKKLFSL